MYQDLEKKTLNPKSKPLHFFLYQVNNFLRHNALKYQVVSQPSLFGLETFVNFRLQNPNFLNFQSKTTTTADDQASGLEIALIFLILEDIYDILDLSLISRW